MKRLLASSLLLAASLWGQVPAGQIVRHYDDNLLSKLTYRVKTEIDLKIPMRDGVSLSADIYRPDVSGQFPAILIRTPYNNNTEAAINQSRFFAERGYVMIQQDVRGKFDSDGQFYPQKNEANDYEAANPVPTLGGNTCCAQQVPSGPWDQRVAERRDDVLVFTSNELTQPVEVTGPLTMKLYASTSAKDTDWTVKLVDVSPDGFARNVQDGVLCARYRDAIGKQDSLLDPGKIYEYTIDMWATSNTFLPGHRIRLEISSSNFPRFDRNLNTGEDPAIGTRLVTAKQTIYHNTKYPSHVLLPVIPRAGSSD